MKNFTTEDTERAEMITITGGMTLRDWFAGQALAGSVSSDSSIKNDVELAYRLADAMLKRREEEVAK